MKQFVTLLFIFGVILITFAMGRKNGAQTLSEGNSLVNNPQTCAASVDCHHSVNGSTLNTVGSLNFVDLPSSFNPGQSYDVGISVVGDATTRVYGFQLVTIHDDKTQAGTLTPTPATAGVGRVLFGTAQVQHLVHTPVPLSSGSINFRWTAPAVPKGPVTFRVASNAANGKDDNKGDHIRTTETRISQAVVKNEKLYFAHFGDGEVPNVAQLFSQVTLVNLSLTTAVNASIEIFDDEGAPMRVDLNGEDLVTGKKDFAIPPAGSVVLKTDAKGTVQAGSVVVSSDLPLAGVILFGGTVGVAGVGSSKPLVKFTAPMETDTAGSINTGIAIMNLENTDQTVLLELIDLGGGVVATGTVGDQPIKPKGHMARLLNEFKWTTPPSLTKFQGTLRVTTTTGGKIAATVLRVSQREFATLPVAELQ